MEPLLIIMLIVGAVFLVVVLKDIIKALIGLMSVILPMVLLAIFVLFLFQRNDRSATVNFDETPTHQVSPIPIEPQQNYQPVNHKSTGQFTSNNLYLEEEMLYEDDEYIYTRKRKLTSVGVH
jgi:hypothetical protein